MIIIRDTEGEEYETEEVFLPGDPFKAESLRTPGMWCWLIQDGNGIRRCGDGDVIDAVSMLNEMFMLEHTEDQFFLAWNYEPGDRCTISTGMGFTTSYSTTEEALDYLIEGLRQDDYYEMLERIERHES